MSTIAKISPGRSAFFLCDIQMKFCTAIHGFADVVATASKMLKIAQVLDIPVFATEQNRLKLGPTVPELVSQLESLGPLHVGIVDKTLFSMVTPQIESRLRSEQHRDIKSVVLFGIETHICVLQTALDLLEKGYEVHVLADGVSSCNKQEAPWALARMRQAGVQITTSESIAFQLMADSSKPNFRTFAAIIKDEKDTTMKAVNTLLGHQPLP